jgi:hypothetical protein
MSVEQRYGKNWEVYDGTASEVEMGDLLYGLVRMLKPDLVVETGTYKGNSTQRMAKAVEKNGLGRIVTCDPYQNNPWFPPAWPEITFKRCESLSVEELKEADFVFSDSHEDVRMLEYELVKPGCVFVIHDTDQPYHSSSPPYLGELVKKAGGLIFHAGRGFGILVK